MNRLFLFLIIAPLALASELAALADGPLSLVEAMRRARHQAPVVAAAEARGRAAAAELRRARGHRLPSIRLSETWIRTDSPADAFGLLLNQERFSFADFVAGDPNRPDPLETATTRLELELPLWTGGEISTRIEQARLAAEAARARTGRAGDLAAAGAGSAWLGLARAREAVALLERSRATVAAHADLARSYAQQGMIVRSELLRAEVELARIDDLLAEARAGAEVAAANLAYRLGDPLDSSYRLAAVAAPPRATGELEAWLAAADDRADLDAARRMLAAGELEARARAASARPRVGLVARRDWTDDRLFGANGSSTSVLAAASIDLFDGGRRRGAVAAARAEAEAGRRELESFADGVRLEVRQAHAAASAALDRHRTALAALDAAAEAVRIVEERFRAGVVRTLDVLDAATARREAEMRELDARADALDGLLRLAAAAGHAPETLLMPETESPGDPS